MSDSIIALTVEQVIEKARTESLSKKKIRSLLYHSKLLDQETAVWEALGLTKGPDETAINEAKRAEREVAQAAQRAAWEEKVAQEKAAADQAAIAAAVEKERLAALRLPEGAVIFCDAGKNTIKRVVNGYGKQVEFDNGGFRAAIKCGEIVRCHSNTKCPDSFAGECWAVLKAIELACEHGIKSCTISSDCIGGWTATKKDPWKYIGAYYLKIAREMAEKHGLQVIFDKCVRENNQADVVGRRAGKVAR